MCAVIQYFDQKVGGGHADRQTQKVTPTYKNTHRQLQTQKGRVDKDKGIKADSPGVIYTDLFFSSS